MLAKFATTPRVCEECGLDRLEHRQSSGGKVHPCGMENRRSGTPIILSPLTSPKPIVSYYWQRKDTKAALNDRYRELDVDLGNLVGDSLRALLV